MPFQAPHLPQLRIRFYKLPKRFYKLPKRPHLKAERLLKQ
jgi:hypothetical protein